MPLAVQRGNVHFYLRRNVAFVPENTKAAHEDLAFKAEDNLLRERAHPFREPPALAPLLALLQIELRDGEMFVLTGAKYDGHWQCFTAFGS